MKNVTVIDGEGRGTKRDGWIDPTNIEFPTRRLKVLMPILQMGDEERTMADRYAKIDVIEEALYSILNELTDALKKAGVDI